MVQIREYAASDSDACFRIFDSNLPLFFDLSERAYLANWLLARDERRMAHASNLAEEFYVMEQDGVVVGCAGFYIPVNEMRANMVWGMVENKYHKKGLGRQLLAHRISLIKQHYPACSISLDTTQHSFRFFERMGFSVTGILLNYYGPGLDRYDMLLP